MQIYFEQKGLTMLIRFQHELDQHRVDMLRKRIDAEFYLSAARNIILDFTEVTFMDSSGIGMVMGRYKNTQRRDGKTVLICNNQKMRSILSLSGVLKYVPTFENMENALENIHIADDCELGGI